MALVLKYETVEYIKDKMVEFRLYEDGTFTVNDKVKPWYKTSFAPNGKPWIPAKRKSFVSLVRQGIRDGDYD
jgi:hypothetical protein